VLLGPWEPWALGPVQVGGPNLLNFLNPISLKTTVIITIRPHRQHTMQLQLVVASVSVGLLIATVCCAKTAEPVEVPFGVWTRGGPRNHVLDGSPDSSGRMGSFGGGREISPVVKYR